MPMLCSICQGDICERPEVIESSNEEVVIVALLCGHVFHKACINQWFSSRQWSDLGQCPCCKKLAKLSHALKIFPTADDAEVGAGNNGTDAASTAALNTKITELTAAKENLEIRLVTTEQVWRIRFENVDDELELLKLQHAETLSLVQSLQDQVQDYTEIKLALENSTKTAVEKLEQEKELLLSKIEIIDTAARNLATKAHGYHMFSAEVTKLNALLNKTF